MDKAELIKELRDKQLWLKKSYGQHFLVEPQYLDTIIKEAQISATGTVVEVGPGLGVLTKRLADVVKDGLVLSIEADFKLVDLLRNDVGKMKNVKIIHSNALIYNWEDINGPYQIVANLPYNVASPLIYNWLIKTEHAPTRITVMLQKEVAERLSAKPGTRARGLPTIMVELAGEAKIIAEVPPSAFFPPPKVDSAIIDIKLKKKVGDELAILKVTKAGFANKRRTLENSLSGSLRLPKEDVRNVLKLAKIDIKYRAEDLSLSQWRQLTKEIIKFID